MINGEANKDTTLLLEQESDNEEINIVDDEERDSQPHRYSFFQDLPIFIRELAAFINISPYELNQYYINNDGFYHKISLLDCFINNFNQQKTLAALSLEDVRNCTGIEALNLSVGRVYIEEELLTLDEVRNLTDEQRMSLVNNNSDFISRERAAKNIFNQTDTPRLQ